MIKKKLMISSLVLLLCTNCALFASCGRNKDTTHDANGNGQVVTENKNDSTDKKNENGVVGEIVTDVKDGVGDVVDGVGDMIGGDMNGNENETANNGAVNDGTTNDGTTNDGTTNDGGVTARGRRMPRIGK